MIPARSDEHAAAVPASIASSVPEQPAAVPASAQTMTREEFDAYSAGVARTMTALLNEYGKRRDSEIAGVLQIALSDLADRQNRDYRDLKGRIENVAQGLADEQFRTNLQVDYLLREDQQPVSPARRSLSDQ
jgi:phytoene dehydrogenase-like protein